MLKEKKYYFMLPHRKPEETIGVYGKERHSLPFTAPLPPTFRFHSTNIATQYTSIRSYPTIASYSPHLPVDHTFPIIACSVLGTHPPHRYTSLSDTSTRRPSHTPERSKPRFSKWHLHPGSVMREALPTLFTLRAPRNCYSCCNF